MGAYVGTRVQGLQKASGELHVTAGVQCLNSSSAAGRQCVTFAQVFCIKNGSWSMQDMRRH